MEKNKASSRKYLRYFLIFTAAVVSVALVYTSIAYMIKQTELTNRFTKRDFDIDLLEPQYDLLPEESRNNLVPNDTVAKDPKVKNTKDTDAFVFLKVTVPVAEITEYDIYSMSRDFSYTGDVQSVRIEKSGYYLLEAWGAAGGGAKVSENGAYPVTGTSFADFDSKLVDAEGGRGGYSSGEIYLEEGQIIYCAVGGKGERYHKANDSNNSFLDEENHTHIVSTIKGGYNGGGTLTASDSGYVYCGTGGGATHFALSTGVLSSLENQTQNVLLVAGGGGGSGIYMGQTSDSYRQWRVGLGGAGGGTESQGNYGNSTYNNSMDVNVYGSTKNSAGTAYNNPHSTLVYPGSFGQGGTIKPGGGGGYYGGTAIAFEGAAGGSGYTKETMRNTQMITGNTVDFTTSANELVEPTPMPTHPGAIVDDGVVGTGSSAKTMIGNRGDGYARITYVGDPPTKHNDEIFYLKTTGTSLYGLSNVFNNTPADASDNGYWVELTGREEGTDLSGETRTYVFGYSVYLTPEEESETLFDFVQLKNILQYELDPDDDIHIQVDAYGIQADYLEGINKNNGNNKAIMTQAQLNTIFGYILS